MDVLLRDGPSLSASWRGGHAAAFAAAKRDEAHTAQTEQVGGKSSDGVIWEIGDKELEKREGLGARGMQGAEVRVPVMRRTARHVEAKEAAAEGGRKETICWTISGGSRASGDSSRDGGRGAWRRMRVKRARM